MKTLKYFFSCLLFSYLGSQALARGQDVEVAGRREIIAICKGEARRPRLKPVELEAIVIQAKDKNGAYFEVTVKVKFSQWTPVETLLTRTGDSKGRIIFSDDNQSEKFIYDASGSQSNPYAIWRSPRGWNTEWFLCWNDR